MVKPLTSEEQQLQTKFTQQHTLAVTIGVSHYDAITEEGQQVLPNVPQSARDCESLRQSLAKFGVENDDDLHSLNGSPSEEEIQSVFNDLSLRIKAEPDVKHCVFILFAGHGIQTGSEHRIACSIQKANKFILQSNVPH